MYEEEGLVWPPDIDEFVEKCPHLCIASFNILSLRQRHSLILARWKNRHAVTTDVIFMDMNPVSERQRTYANVCPSQVPTSRLWVSVRDPPIERLITPSEMWKFHGWAPDKTRINMGDLKWSVAARLAGNMFECRSVTAALLSAFSVVNIPSFASRPS